MILLVSGASLTMERIKSNPHLGALLTPQSGQSVDRIIGWGCPWACDNGCFKSLNESAYRRMLKSVSRRPRCLWVTAPDVVARAGETLELFNKWEPKIHKLGLPVAFVAQDGIEKIKIPWDRFECLFIGGTTEFKLHRKTQELCLEAKRRGKLVHVGRVNSYRRLRRCMWMKADTVDGSGFSKWPDQKIPTALKQLRELKKEFANLLIPL